MQIFNNSEMQLWPISIKIFHANYVSKPFVIAIYCGDSKPQSSVTYLNDFVTEATNLINNDIEIYGKKYSFEIMAIIADAPARAFIKCCKPPNSFYACEKCITKGVSVGSKRSKKRVYPEMDCLKRSKESFLKQQQVRHQV